MEQYKNINKVQETLKGMRPEIQLITCEFCREADGLLLTYKEQYSLTDEELFTTIDLIKLGLEDVLSVTRSDIVASEIL